MAKKFKSSELRKAYFSGCVSLIKERITGAMFLSVVAAGLSVLFNAIKDDADSEKQ